MGTFLEARPESVAQGNLQRLLVLNRVEVAANVLVHLKHGDAARFEDGVQLVVAHDLSLVGGVLQLVRLDVFPELTHYLGTWELCGSSVSSIKHDDCSGIRLCLPSSLRTHPKALR